MVVAFCVHFLVLHKGEFPELSLCYVLSCRATLCTGAKQIEFGFINFFFALFLYFRLNTAQIPCPEPIMLRSHVLVMGFIGKGDR